MKNAKLSGAMETWLRSSSAYQLGLNSSGKIVFAHPRQAWNQMKRDRRSAINTIQWNYQVIVPLTRWYYNIYYKLGWQISETQEGHEKGRLLTQFLGIYQTSFE